MSEQKRPKWLEDFLFKEPDYEAMWAAAREAGARCAIDREKRLWEAFMAAGENHTAFTTGTPATSGTLSPDELVAVTRGLAEERREIDADLARTLTRLIFESGRGQEVWARRLGVSFAELVETLEGHRPPDGRFWNGVGRLFDPHRGKESVGFADILGDAIADETPPPDPTQRPPEAR